MSRDARAGAGMCDSAGCERYAAAGSKYCRPCGARLESEHIAARESGAGELDLFAPAGAPRIVRTEMHAVPIAELRQLRQRQRAPDSFADSPPSAPGSATSQAAAEAIAPRYRTKLALVYWHLWERGPHGATRQEIADACGMLLQSVCAAVRTLYLQGLAGSNAGEMRPNRISGLANEVVVHEDYVRRWHPEQRRPPELRARLAVDPTAGTADEPEQAP